MESNKPQFSPTPITPELKSQIRDIFKSFDKDQSGFIDRGEVKLVSKELGQEVTDDEINKIFAEIDTNKDNKLSFHEFYNWWCYGKVNKMEGLVYYKLKALNLLDKHKALQERLGHILKDDYESKLDNTLHFGVSFGQYEPKTKLSWKFLASEAGEKKFKEITEKMKANPLFSIILKARCAHNPKEAEEGLRKLIDSITSPKEEEGEKGEEGAGLPDSAKMILSLLDIEVSSDEKYVYLVVSTKGEFLADMIEMGLSEKMPFLNENSGLNTSFSLNLKNDLSTLLNDFPNEQLILSLLQGFAVNVDVTANESIVKKLSQEIQGLIETKGEIVPEELKAQTITSLSRGTTVDINLQGAEKEKLEDLIKMIGASIPSFIDVLNLVKGMGVLNILQVKPMLNDVVQFARSHLRAEIEVAMKISKGLILIELQTSGVKECFDYLSERNE